MKVASKPATTTRSTSSGNAPRYLLMAGSSVQFVVLTVAAMLIYPGGMINDDSTQGYDFFRNFFSDLGRITSYAGDPQWGSAILFFIALALGGVGIIHFFINAPRLFKQQKLPRALSFVGSAFGVVSGLSFIGVALTPASIRSLIDWHILFVQVAFSVFMVVVICYGLAIWLTPHYPNMYATVFAIFGIVLAGYIYLLFWGPPSNTDIGLRINATGQKIIAYSSLITMAIQSVGAWRISAKS